MKNWARRIRGAIAMGISWGAAWFAAGILLARVPGFYSDLPFALLFAQLGFVTGVIFSGPNGDPAEPELTENQERELLGRAD